MNLSIVVVYIFLFLGRLFSPDLGEPSSDPDLCEWVDRVGSTLAGDHSYCLTVVETDEVNAWAFPSGEIAISRAMLESMSSDAHLAFILGHEMGHIEKRHVGWRHLHAMGATAASFFTGSPICGQLLCYQQSRAQEREADRYALLLLDHAGYDRQAALDWFCLFEGDGFQCDLLCTHPRGIKRIGPLLNAET